MRGGDTLLRLVWAIRLFLFGQLLALSLLCNFPLSCFDKVSGSSVTIGLIREMQKASNWALFSFDMV